MAWVFSSSASFGICAPSGDFPNWKQQLREVTGKQHPRASEFLEYFEGARLGPPKDEIVPKTFQMKKKRDKLGDWLNVTNRLELVTLEMKNIVEKLEPDVHRFWPIEFLDHKGNPIGKQYFVLWVGQTLQTFVPEKSNPRSWYTTRGGGYGVEDSTIAQEMRKIASGLSFSTEKIGGKTLWREARMLHVEHCFSDQLKAAIDAAGLKIPNHYKVKEV